MQIPFLVISEYLSRNGEKLGNGFVWEVSTQAEQGHAFVLSIVRYNFSKTDGKQAVLENL